MWGGSSTLCVFIPLCLLFYSFKFVFHSVVFVGEIKNEIREGKDTYLREHLYVCLFMLMRVFVCMCVRKSVS